MTHEDDPLSARIGAKAAAKRRARRRHGADIWYGLGLFGLLGWSIAIPTLLGLALGIWIDTTWASPLSWTLMLLLAGVIVGSLNAWLWVDRERREIERSREEEEEHDA